MFAVHVKRLVSVVLAVCALAVFVYYYSLPELSLVSPVERRSRAEGQGDYSALFVPYSALCTIDGRECVFVLSDRGIIETEISCGDLLCDEMLAVVSGISADDMVVEHSKTVISAEQYRR